MAKTVGLSRSIKLQWLNKTVQMLDEQLPEPEFKKELNEYLSFEITSETVLRKTREILMRIWYYSDPDIDPYRDLGRKLISKHPDYAMCIHWCIMLLVYPVFTDLSRMVGRTAELQDQIVLTQLKKRLFDEWGERTTLYHSIDKIFATMKYMGAIRSEGAGRYSIVEHQIKDDDVVGFIIWSALALEEGGYSAYSELNHLTYMFPFVFTVSKEQLCSDKRFILSSFGGEQTVSLSSGTDG